MNPAFPMNRTLPSPRPPIASRGRPLRRAAGTAGNARRLAAGLAAVALLLGLGRTAAVPPGPSPTLALAPAAEVSGEGIYLDQVVVADPPTALPRLRLAPAPAFGAIAALTRAQVAAFLRTNAPDFALTNWTGLDQVKVSRRTRSLEETEIRELLRATLQTQHVKERGELELRLSRPWNPVLVADDDLTLRVLDLPATGPGANFIVRFEILAGEERLGAWQLAVLGRIWREIPVALAPVKRGQLLRDAPIGLERRDVLALRDAPGLMPPGQGDLEFTENVGAGQPILARSVRFRPVIQRGQLVDGVVEDGALMITLKVEAAEDALTGQVIRVRNPRTRRELTGKVLNEQTILITR